MTWLMKLSFADEKRKKEKEEKNLAKIRIWYELDPIVNVLSSNYPNAKKKEVS